jgi:hypothetical protein
MERSAQYRRINRTRQHDFLGVLNEKEAVSLFFTRHPFHDGNSIV